MMGDNGDEVFTWLNNSYVSLYLLQPNNLATQLKSIMAGKIKRTTATNSTVLLTIKKQPVHNSGICNFEVLLHPKLPLLENMPQIYAIVSVVMPTELGHVQCYLESYLHKPLPLYYWEKKILTKI